MRLKLDSNDYEEKLREIRAALNRIPKYMENPEFKKAIENTQRVQLHWEIWSWQFLKVKRLKHLVD